MMIGTVEELWKHTKAFQAENQPPRLIHRPDTPRWVVDGIKSCFLAKKEQPPPPDLLMPACTERQIYRIFLKCRYCPRPGMRAQAQRRLHVLITTHKLEPWEPKQIEVPERLSPEVFRNGVRKVMLGASKNNALALLETPTNQILFPSWGHMGDEICKVHPDRQELRCDEFHAISCCTVEGEGRYEMHV